MNLVDTLEVCRKNKKNIKPILRGFGAVNWNVFVKPMEALPEEQANALLLNWLALAIKSRVHVKVRNRGDDNTVYDVCLKGHCRSILVKSISKCSMLRTDSMYKWWSGVTPNMLTLKHSEVELKRAEKCKRQ